MAFWSHISSAVGACSDQGVSIPHVRRYFPSVSVSSVLHMELADTHTHIHIPIPHAHVEMTAVFRPEVPLHIRPALIIKGRGVRVDPLSVQLRAGDPLILSLGFVWASGLTHLPTPQASVRPWSGGQLLFSSNNCS